MPLVSRSQIFMDFLRIGSVGYGGPIALVALMEQECVKKRKWLTPEAFSELFLFCKLLPGPVAYQMSLAIGHHLRGRWGGVVAGVAFLLPSFVLILLFSIYYASLRGFTAVEKALLGVRAGALVILVDSSLRLAAPYRKDRRAWTFIFGATIGMWLLPRWEPLLIIGAGILSILLFRRRQTGLLSVLWPLFWVHFKAGSMVFGTGLAIVPVLEREVVQHYQWLTSAEFLDGLAFGQVTPGPITITSVFIGYRVASYLGALIGLLGMYLPGIGFVLFLLPALRSRLAGQGWLQHFQAGAVPAVVGCILGATALLARTTLTDVWLIGIFLVLALAAWFIRLPAWLIIPIGAVAGYALVP